MRSRLVNPLILAAIGHLILEVCNNYLPVIYPLLIDAMGLSYTHVGVIALVATTGMALTQPLFGYVSDRWSTEKMSAFSIIWTGVVMGLVGCAWNYSSLLFLIALGSLGSAAFHPASAVIAANHSGPRRGRGISIFSVGGNIGSALSPLWMAMAIAAFGLAGTTTLIPVSVIIGGVLYWQLRQTSVRQQGEVGRQPTAATDSFPLGLALVVVGMMFRSWFQVTLATYLPVWAESSGGTLATGGRMLAVLLFSVSIGSFVGGPIADRFGHWQIFALSLACMTPVLWLFMRLSGLAQLLLLVGMGVAIGATYPGSIVMALESWPHQVGMASGLLMGLGWWPGGIGASLTGFIADRFSLTVGLQTLLFPPLIGLACILAYAALQRSRRITLPSTLEP